MTAPLLFLVDDEPAARYAARRALASSGCEIRELESGEGCLAALAEARPSAILLDVSMPGMGGVRALEEIVRRPDAPAVVMMTAFGDERLVVDLWQKGAYDYLPKPYEVSELQAKVRRALERSRLEEENRTLRQELLRRDPEPTLGASGPMAAVGRMIERIAPSDVSVLLTGESGSGKEVAARAIHQRSPRRERGFVALNCAALPEDLVESELFGHERGAFTGAVELRRGRFEQADGGTLFLDEVAEMAPRTQVKLLRVLQERCFERVGGSRTIAVDVRLIAATNRDLKVEVAKGRFREDLLYRLKVVEIALPALRERRADILPLALDFLRQACARRGRAPAGLTPEAQALLEQASWPGNVRELRNAIEHAAVMSDGGPITVDQLPADLRQAPQAEPARPAPESRELDLAYADARRLAIEAFERRYLAGRLRRTRGNVSEAAREMGLARQSLQFKLKELGLDPAVFRLPVEPPG